TCLACVVLSSAPTPPTCSLSLHDALPIWFLDQVLGTDVPFITIGSHAATTPCCLVHTRVTRHLRPSPSSLHWPAPAGMNRLSPLRRDMDSSPSQRAPVPSSTSTETNDSGPQSRVKRPSITSTVK